MIGSGTLSSPWLVESISDLNLVRSNLSAHYKQMAHIDLVSVGNFQKIGNASTKFTGTYDGNGFEIRNLTISVNDFEVGLFGNVLNATLKNIRVVNGSVTNLGSYSPTGGLVALANGGSITNCHYQGTVTSGGIETGGLMGTGGNVPLTDCSANATVIGTSEVGGLVADYVGTMERCFSKGTVRASTSFAGGLIAILQTATVNDCYSNSSVFSNDYAGGLVALINTLGTIRRSYATGSVEGLTKCAGFIGTSTGTGSSIRDCYTLSPYVRRVSGTNTEFARFMATVSGTVANFSNNYALDTMEFRG
jgi:hypothetical protein